MVEQIGSTFGERIKYLRKQKKLTQRQIALKSGSNHTTISRLERSNRTPNLKTAVQIVMALSSDPLERLTVYESGMNDADQKREWDDTHTPQNDSTGVYADNDQYQLRGGLQGTDPRLKTRITDIS